MRDLWVGVSVVGRVRTDEGFGIDLRVRWRMGVKILTRFGELNRELEVNHRNWSRIWGLGSGMEGGRRKNTRDKGVGFVYFFVYGHKAAARSIYPIR